MTRPKSRVTKVVTVMGPLAPFTAAYRSRLEECGYTPLSIVNQLRQVAHLSRWMEASSLVATDLTTERIEEFLVPRRVARGSGNCSFKALVPMVDVVTHAALPERVSPRPQSANDAILVRFHGYLLAERGLAAGTAGAYVARARRFVEDLPDGGEIGDLCVGDVTGAVEREAARVSIGSTHYFVAGLRAFLRFCFVEGIVDADLSGAALGVMGRRRSSLPKGISGTDAAALVRSCDRRRSDGRRDHAVLLVLLRLGLRAGEVARMTLDDIDWRAGEVTVHGKGRRQDRLPLPVDVGEAIAGYLQRGRPKTTEREVFLRVLAPLGPLGRGGVSSIVRRACRRAGIEAVGAHRLRHTLACDLLAADAGLAEIGELLRHRGISSTAIYACVDIDTLRGVALPWPGGEMR